MIRRFRLTRTTDFKRVRRSGKSYAHPLVVLYVAVSNLAHPRIGIAAGKTVGKAVQRNRVKRLLRAVMHDLLPLIVPGHDIIVIARASLVQASFPEISEALKQLCMRADLLVETNIE